MHNVQSMQSDELRSIVRTLATGFAAKHFAPTE